MTHFLTFTGILVASAAVILYLLTMGQRADMAFDMPNMQTPASNVMTGGQPSKEDLARLKADGFSRVVNLRLPGEFTDFDEPAEVTALGMTYIDLPVDMRGGLSRANAEKLDALLQDSSPVLVHCGSGDRVGALFALRAFYLESASVEDAITVGKASGLNRLESMVREAMQAERR